MEGIEEGVRGLRVDVHGVKERRAKSGKANWIRKIEDEIWVPWGK